jgi:hypothetical protein
MRSNVRACKRRGKTLIDIHRMNRLATCSSERYLSDTVFPMDSSSTTRTPADTFIERWSRAEASERANAQLFLSELSDLLEVPRPSNTHADGYTFEFPVKIPLRDGSLGDGRIDLYRRDAFVLEAKQYATLRTRRVRNPTLPASWNRQASISRPRRAAQRAVLFVAVELGTTP